MTAHAAHAGCPRQNARKPLIPLSPRCPRRLLRASRMKMPFCDQATRNKTLSSYPWAAWAAWAYILNQRLIKNYGVGSGVGSGVGIIMWKKTDKNTIESESGYRIYCEPANPGLRYLVWRKDPGWKDAVRAHYAAGEPVPMLWRVVGCYNSVAAAKQACTPDVSADIKGSKKTVTPNRSAARSEEN